MCKTYELKTIKHCLEKLKKAYLNGETHHVYRLETQ